MAAMTVIVALGFIRIAADAEYAFASVVVLPVVLVAWIGGRKDGLTFSLLAATFWASTDWFADRQFSAAWVPVLNGLTRLGVYGLVAILTAEVRTLLARERSMARHDALTDLMNRRAFFEAGNAEVERCRRYGHPLGIAFLDLDSFKRLNDRLGHEAGDRALKAVAGALTGSLRNTDRLARLGGDEFAILLPELDFEATTETGKKIADAVDTALRKFPPVSVSLGVAWFDSATQGFPAMLGAADALMYEVKRSGKRGVRAKRFATPTTCSQETSAQ